MQQQDIYSELDEELNIDLKKIFLAILSKKGVIFKVTIITLAFFILLTFILPKKYSVSADLYINKSNNSNLVDINPYVLGELTSVGGLSSVLSGANSTLINELELIQSPLVIDNVIKENNIRYKKIFGIFPNKKEGEYVSTKDFMKNKKLEIENKKGTNIITLSYTSKKPELAYGVVNSVINNYILFYKELNSEKSQADIKILEEQYNKAKSSLQAKAKRSSIVPDQALTGGGNVVTLSAFSKSALSAMNQIQSQYKRGAESRLELEEDTSKVANLSSKLEWAKLVDKMSDTSKVLVIKEPEKLRPFENSSPKLFKNILLGIVFSVIFSIVGVIISELTDKKLTYSALGENIIYNLKKEYLNLKILLLSNKDKIAFVDFTNSKELISSIQKEFQNTSYVKADISREFQNEIQYTDKIIFFEKIGNTDMELYKQIKKLVEVQNKKIVTEILL